MGDPIDNPIRGNDGCYFTMQLADDPAVELEGHVKKVEMDNGDRDDLTFGEINRGETKDHTLKVTGIQSLTPGTLWRMLHDNPRGMFRVVWGPYGNAIPTEDRPHVVGLVKVDGKPKLGQEARTGRTREEFEVELHFEGEYDLVGA